MTTSTNANHQPLNNVTHQDIKVITARHPSLGDNVAVTTVFPVELTQLQADFPILLKKSGENRFELIALMGFSEGENLLFDGDVWTASTVPLTMIRSPFLIGFEMQMDNGIPVESPVVHIDMDSPRISNSQGQPLFLPQGGNSEYLDYITRVLITIHQGQAQTDQQVELIQKHDLIEPLAINMTMPSGNKLNVEGMLTINEEKFNALTSDAIVELHQSGALTTIYMMLASLANVKKLVNTKVKNEE
jgi:hypothetical protein